MQSTNPSLVCPKCHGQPTRETRYEQRGIVTVIYLCGHDHSWLVKWDA